MTQTSEEKSEELIFADDRPTSVGDDLYQWAVDAEDMIRRLHARVQELEATVNKSLTVEAESVTVRAVRKGGNDCGV